MPNLILIKHSLPEIDKNVPAREWQLSAEGRSRCAWLAEAVTPYQPQVIVTSREPKAIETGQLLAERWQIPISAAPNLHEHERQRTPFLSSEVFEARLRSFFEHPGQQVLGEETAEAAHTRFAEALWSLVNAHPSENLAIVAHGTVISLFVARLVGLEPFPLWEQLGLPSFVVISLPEKRLVTVGQP